MIIILVGESASGKTTLMNNFIQRHPDYRKAISYTTRPPREGEVDGVDYHFVSMDEFNRMARNNQLLESVTYNGWNYGTANGEFGGNDIIAVMNPAGMRALARAGIKFISVYLKVDRRTRLISILNRGDNIDEACRRSIHDEGQFTNIEDETNYVIRNNGFFKDEMRVLSELESIVSECEKWQE